MQVAEIAAEAGVSIEALVNELIIEGAKEKLKELQPFPQLTIQKRGRRERKKVGVTARLL
jgi:hypothetical protein